MDAWLWCKAKPFIHNVCVLICTQVNEQLGNRIKDFSKVLARMEMDKKYVVVVCLNVNVIYYNVIFTA